MKRTIVVVCLFFIYSVSAVSQDFKKVIQIVSDMEESLKTSIGKEETQRKSDIASIKEELQAIRTSKDTSSNVNERVAVLEKKVNALQPASDTPAMAKNLSDLIVELKKVINQTQTAQPSAIKSSSPSIQFSGQTFMYYSYSPQGSDGKYANKFDFDRLYLTAKGTVSDEIKYVYTTDVYRDTTMKQDYGLTIRVKLAYFDYVPFPELSFKAGVIPNAWTGFVDTYWKYRGISTNFVDRNGFYKSTDLGISSQYALPGKIGEVAVFVLNGDGFTSREQNRFKDVAARLCLTPFKETPVLSNMMFAGYGYKGANASIGGDALQRDRAGFLTGYADSYFSVYVEGEKRWDAAVKPDSVITGSGVSFFSEIKVPIEELKNKLSIVLRWDVIDPNKNKGGDMTRFAIAGVAYRFNDKFTLVLDNQSLNGETSTIKVVDGTKTDYDGRWYVHTLINF